MLTDGIEALCHELLVGGRQEGAEYRAGNLEGEPGRSLGIRLTGPKAGLWCDFATGEGGDALDLVKAVLGLDTAEAIKWAKRWLGTDAAITERNPQRTSRRARVTSKRWSPSADAIWNATQSLVGTCGETYLVGRKCALPESDEVRFHPNLGHWPTRTNWPALVARVTDAVTAEAMSLHLTFLDRNGAGKAPIDRPKLLLSGHAKAGGVIRLADDAEVTTGLMVGEGVETVLSAARHFAPAWAALDAGNLRRLPVLDGIEALTILVDDDDAGRRAAKACAARWQAADREARIWSAN